MSKAYVNGVAAQQKSISTGNYSFFMKVLLASLFLLITFFGYVKYQTVQSENTQSKIIISSPEINDIYFLDFRLLPEFRNNKLRPTEKYRLAKVIDITGDIITLAYGAFYYQRQHAVKNSIKYGQLSYQNSFDPKRYDIPHSRIKEFLSNETIYLAKRPVRNKLYGNLVGPEKVKQSSKFYKYGEKENHKGEVYLAEPYSEMNFERAFDLFKKSSSLGFVTGQLNLAKMYINGMHVKQDLSLALYWLKQASLQSSKSAIYKYGIICKQVIDCNVLDFYQEMNDAGVNIKVRNVRFELNK